MRPALSLERPKCSRSELRTLLLQQWKQMDAAERAPWLAKVPVSTAAPASKALDAAGAASAAAAPLLRPEADDALLSPPRTPALATRPAAKHTPHKRAGPSSFARIASAVNEMMTVAAAAAAARDGARDGARSGQVEASAPMDEDANVHTAFDVCAVDAAPASLLQEESMIDVRGLTKAAGQVGRGSVNLASNEYLAADGSTPLRVVGAPRRYCKKHGKYHVCDGTRWTAAADMSGSGGGDGAAVEDEPYAFGEGEGAVPGEGEGEGIPVGSGSTLQGEVPAALAGASKARAKATRPNNSRVGTSGSGTEDIEDGPRNLKRFSKRAQDYMYEVLPTSTPPGSALSALLYRSHVFMITHGAILCGETPQCGDCPLRSNCEYGSLLRADDSTGKGRACFAADSAPLAVVATAASAVAPLIAPLIAAAPLIAGTVAPAAGTVAIAVPIPPAGTGSSDVAQQLTEPLTEHTHAGTGSSDISAIPIEDLDDGVGVQHLATVGSFAMMSMAPSEAPIRDPTVPMALSPLLPSLAPDASAPAPLARRVVRSRRRSVRARASC